MASFTNFLLPVFLLPISCAAFFGNFPWGARWDKANSISFNFCRNWQQNTRRSAESCHVCIPLSVAGSHSIWPFVKVAVTEKSFDTQRGSRLSSFDVLSQTRMPKKSRRLDGSRRLDPWGTIHHSHRLDITIWWSRKQRVANPLESLSTCRNKSAPRLLQLAMLLSKAPSCCCNRIITTSINGQSFYILRNDLDFWVIQTMSLSIQVSFSPRTSKGFQGISVSVKSVNIC